MASRGRELTVGIDIGTSSVKAVAADGDGTVVASARVPHEFGVPTAMRFEHDAIEAWQLGPQRALAALGDAGRDARGVSVAAMVPSLTAVDAEGTPFTPGLLYGDDRAAAPNADGPGAKGSDAGGMMSEQGEWSRQLRWTATEAPGAPGYWPAQTVANHALAGEAVLDTTTAALAYPVFDFRQWDEALVEAAGARVEQLPRLVPTGWECGRVGGADGPALASGCVDAMAEQLVAGADGDGDVLALLGTTLIVWAVTTQETVPDGYVLIPHTAPGRFLAGGPSNAGGLFLNWAAHLVGAEPPPADPGRVPLFVPYPRGERVPLHDTTRRAEIVGLDLTHGPGAIRRAAFEACGFATRRMLDATGASSQRIVASGGGTRVDEWVQAYADATGLPVDCVAVPEGGALGSAWLARIAAGLEEPTAMTEGRRWARTGRRVEPDPRWVGPTAERYEQWLELA